MKILFLIKLNLGKGFANELTERKSQTPLALRMDELNQQ